MMRYTLEQRVERLEKMLLLEGKKDQEILRAFLGDSYYDKYQAIKNKISDPEFKDIYKIIKKDLGVVKDFIDSTESNTEKRKASKSSGSEKVLDKDGYKIYRITTREAAGLYGSHTKWCISGRLSDEGDDVDDGSGHGFFNAYIKNPNTEKAYYFIITPTNHKFCATRKLSGDIITIWNEMDDTIDIDKFLSKHPVVKEFFTAQNKSVSTQDSPERRDSINSQLERAAVGTSPSAVRVKELLSAGADPNYTPIHKQTMLHRLAQFRKLSPEELEIADAFIKAGCNVNARDFAGETALLAAVNNIPFAKMLIEAGANPNIANNKGETPLSKCKKASIRKLLVVAGAVG